MKLKMKTPPKNQFYASLKAAAFTLIELLVVIGIIAILAAMVLGIGAMVGQKKTVARAQAQMHKLQTAIENYKSKMGFYPPGNGRTHIDRRQEAVNQSAARNQLFYELTGTVFNGTDRYTNVFGEVLTSAQINSYFNVTDFANSATSREEVQNFWSTVSPDELGNVNTSASALTLPVWVFVLPGDGPLAFQSQERDRRQRYVVPWCYDSSSTNRINADSYDLWIDIILGGKTNRICNWSDSPLVM